MSTTPSVTSILSQQFDLIYRTAEANLAGMTREHSLVQPEPAGNCANWELAHLVQVQNSVLLVLGGDPFWTDSRLPRIGVPPVTDESDAFDWDGMKEAWTNSRDQVIGAIERQSDESWATPLPSPFGGTVTRAEMISLLANHQPYHIGQLGLLRRLVGLDGAVKGPSEM